MPIASYVQGLHRYRTLKVDFCCNHRYNAPNVCKRVLFEFDVFSVAAGWGSGSFFYLYSIATESKGNIYPVLRSYLEHFRFD